MRPLTVVEFYDGSLVDQLLLEGKLTQPLCPYHTHDTIMKKHESAEISSSRFISTGHRLTADTPSPIKPALVSDFN